jgi:hypothetical protein
VRFTLCLPYYENPGMLRRQLDCWAAYGPEARAAVDVVVVDDGSPRNPALDVLAGFGGLALRLYRINENIPWNQHGARNLAAKAAGKGDHWLLMTDMDHLLEPDQAAALAQLKLRPDRHYIFDRITLPSRRPFKRHCNSFLVSRAAYWRTGGYDEDYCGTYGGDGPFLRFLRSEAPEAHSGARLLRVPREVEPDASTTEWGREGPMKDEYRARQKAKNKSGDAHPKDPLRFTWSRVL